MRVRTYEDALEAQAGGFHGAPFGLGDRADLPAEAHLSGKADVGRDGIVKIGREDGADNSQVAGWIRDAEAAGHVEEHVFLAQFEARTPLQHCQQHVKTADVKARGAALCRTVNGR